MYEILGLKHVFSTFQETVWSHLNIISWREFLAIITFWMKIFKMAAKTSRFAKIMDVEISEIEGNPAPKMTNGI